MIRSAIIWKLRFFDKIEWRIDTLNETHRNQDLNY